MTSSIIVAIDTDSFDQARSWFDCLDPRLCHIKIGKELFTRCGPLVVKEATQRGYSVFLDLKFHDIPKTVERAVLAAVDLGVWMVNVHALGGPRMLGAARQAVDSAGANTRLIAVTILTSFDQTELATVGLSGTPEKNVRHLAQLAFDAGLDGVVCSAQEANLIKSIDQTKLTVTPGIRLVGDVADDQRRIVTPKQAKMNGSDFLVIGRPITQAANPNDVLKKILHELDQ